jgi:hypothetical protein
VLIPGPPRQQLAGTTGCRLPGLGAAAVVVGVWGKLQVRRCGRSPTDRAGR